MDVAASFDPDLVALDEALQELAKLDPRKARVVELRFFGGLSLEETAEALAGFDRYRGKRLASSQGLADA